MPSYNRVIFAGHLTRDPQLKYLPNQTPLVEFGMACNRKYKVGEDQREEVTFIDCAAFGKQAEVLNQYVQKGKPILIEGRLKFDQWEDKQTGQKRTKLSVVIDSFQFLGGQKEDEQPDPKPYPKNRKTVATAPNAESPFGDEQQFEEDDIPF